MITIIHGDNIVESRKHFSEIKAKYSSPKSFDGASVSLTDMVLAVEGGDLFDSNKTVFIEDFLSKRKESKEQNDIVELLNKTQANIFLWEGKNLGKKQLGFFPKAKITPFLLPQILFSFLDNIKPGNNAQILKLFHNLLEQSEAELIFFMIIRQFRLMLSHSKPSVESQNQIDEIKKMAPWQASKIKKQSSYFSQEQLIFLYKKLSDIDLNQKTGSLPYSLTQSVDFFLSGI